MNVTPLSPPTRPRLSVVPEPVASSPSGTADGGDWQARANCLGMDPDLFFPPRGGDSESAKQVCRACEVRAECLDYALANGEKFGVWGGKSERERRRLRRERAVALARRGGVA